MIAVLDFKYYKWAALFFGWLIGGFLGAIIAYFLVQQIMKSKVKNLEFEIALLRICSILIKSDGKIDDNEVKTVKNFFINTYGINRANRIFRQVKISKIRHYSLNQLVDVLKNRMSPANYYSILQLLYQIASSDGNISNEEDQLIFTVGFQLNFTKDRIIAVKSQFVNVKSNSNYDQELLQNLSILGLNENASIYEVKTAYRQLVKDFHPDRLTGVNDRIKDLAKEKFLLIQKAYEYLNKHYKV